MGVKVEKGDKTAAIFAAESGSWRSFLLCGYERVGNGMHREGDPVLDANFAH
jgi:hypothetical protein